MKKDALKTEIARTLIHNTPVRIHLYYPERILEEYGMGQYKTSMRNRILKADVADYIYETHVFIYKGELGLDYVGLQVFSDILGGYIGHEEVCKILNLGESNHDLTKSIQTCVSILRGMTFNELLYFPAIDDIIGADEEIVDDDRMPKEILNNLKYLSRVEMFSRFPLVRLWFNSVRLVKIIFTSHNRAVLGTKWMK